MLLAEPFFKTFTKQALCDTTKQTEGLFALSCNSRGWSFYDLDGHHWEVMWMEPAAAQ